MKDWIQIFKELLHLFTYFVNTPKLKKKKKDKNVKKTGTALRNNDTSTLERMHKESKNR